MGNRVLRVFGEKHALRCVFRNEDERPLGTHATHELARREKRPGDDVGASFDLL